MSLDLVPLAQQAAEYVRRAKASNTVRAYGSDWRDFVSFCRQQGLGELPARPETVALYVTDRAARYKAGTLTRRLAAISQVHQLARFESPIGSATVRQVMQGIRRVLGVRSAAKQPLLVGDIRAIAGKMPDTLIGVRDRAVILIGFAGALRRSELAGLELEDVDRTEHGLVLHLRCGKTDQEGVGRKIAIPRGRYKHTCPVVALDRWLRSAGIECGPIFRLVNRHGRLLPKQMSGEAVALIVKKYVAAIGLDVKEFAGHSLRAGLATAAAMAGKSERSIMQQTGHRSTAMVRRYIRDSNLFRDNAAEGLGL